MSAVVERAVRAALVGQEVPFEVRVHGAARDATEAAAARAEALDVGGKALLIRVRREFMVFALRSSRRLDSRRIKRHFGTTNTRFATPEELLEMTGLVPGAVPPFGQPVLPFPLVVDTSLKQGARVAFTPGTREASILLSTADYLWVARPQETFSFSTEAM